MFSAGFLSWGEIKLQLISKEGKTARQYIKSHTSGGRQGYVGCRGITEVVKGSIHNWNPSHRRLSGLGESDTETDSTGTKRGVQRRAQSDFTGSIGCVPPHTWVLTWKPLTDCTPPQLQPQCGSAAFGLFKIHHNLGRRKRWWDFRTVKGIVHPKVHKYSFRGGYQFTVLGELSL